MRRYFIAAALTAAVLLSGCFSDTPTKVSISEVDETEAVVTTAAAEESGEEKLDEAVRASLESMEARLEELDDISRALESAEEAMTSMEESFQEAVSSLAGETAEASGGGEGTYISYNRLMESPSDYMRAELTFSGRVVQSAELADGDTQLLLAVNYNDATRLVGVFSRSVFPGSLGHGDIVQVTGRFGGVNHYRMGSGETVELPYLEISRLIVESTAQTIPESTAAPATAPETAADAAARQAGPGEAAGGPGEAAGGPGQAAGSAQSAGPGQAAGPGQSAGPGAP